MRGLSIFKRQIESGDFKSTIQDVLLEMPVQFYYKLQKKTLTFDFQIGMGWLFNAPKIGWL